MCAAMPGSRSSRSSANGPAAEVDGRARERVVHRHDRVAVASDPGAVAERGVERLAERERGVLGGVVVAGLEVAGAFEHEVEAGMEGELLEEVVVDAGAGRDSHAALLRRARAASRSASPPSRGRVRTLRPPATAGPAERLEQPVVVLAVEHRHAKRTRERAHDDAPAASSASAIASASSVGT